MTTPKTTPTLPAPTLPAFEIFAPGTHVSMNGDALTFAAGDLAQTAVSYDPSRHQAPICVGHPKTDLPAYGWVKAVSVRDGRLVADPEQVDPAFAALVEAGRFKTRSAAFYRPTAPDNPVPGTWYLRHVAFLGAAPPAVTGLKPIQFSASSDDDTVVVFSGVEPGRLASSLNSIVALIRGFRDYVIEAAGVEKADAILPSWRLNDLAAAAAALDADAPPAFSAPVEDAMTVKAPDPAELERRAAALAQREANFAAREAERTRAENVAFVDGLIQQGRLPSGHKSAVVAFMAALDASGAVAFAAADGATVQKTPLQACRDLLATLPTLVEFRELAAAEPPPAAVAFAAPSGYSVDPDRLALHAKALAHQAAHPDADYTAALRAVGGL